MGPSTPRRLGPLFILGERSRPPLNQPRAIDAQQHRPSNHRHPVAWVVDWPLRKAVKSCCLLGVFYVNSPQVFFNPRSILLVFLSYIKFVLNPRPRQDPSLQILELSLSKENSPKVTIEAKTQGRQGGMVWTCIFTKISGFPSL